MKIENYHPSKQFLTAIKRNYYGRLSESMASDFFSQRGDEVFRTKNLKFGDNINKFVNDLDSCKLAKSLGKNKEKIKSFILKYGPKKGMPDFFVIPKTNPYYPFFVEVKSNSSELRESQFKRAKLIKEGLCLKTYVVRIKLNFKIESHSDIGFWSVRENEFEDFCERFTSEIKEFDKEHMKDFSIIIEHNHKLNKFLG